MRLVAIEFGTKGVAACTKCSRLEFENVLNKMA
jgi:hypothetical protein